MVFNQLFNRHINENKIAIIYIFIKHIAHFKNTLYLCEY